VSRKIDGSRPEDWHAEDVKAAIRKTGVSLAALGVQNGYSSSSIRKALVRRSAAVQALLAGHLGIPPQTIWPSRYDEAGRPLDLRASDKRKNSRRHRAAQRQNHG
jgi:Ner family transcriptional regulator